MKKIVAILFLLVIAVSSFACSTFLLKRNGQLLFGRNYDWITGNGMVTMNARGIKKASLVLPGERGMEWTSVHGSITFNQFGKEFPHGGMNEAGLVVELMWLQGTSYPKADERPALNELQWIQYQLDNFTTVAEVIASNKNIRIGREGAAPLHYLIADASGKAATIEFIDGKMIVHQDKELPYPVLTNTVYSEAISATENGTKTKGFTDNSIERFATACRMVQQFDAVGTQQDGVNYAFSILDKIALGSYTKWRIVYDIANRTIAFITTGSRKTLRLNDFSFTCQHHALYLPLHGAQKGNVGKSFSQLTAAENEKILRKSARESKTQIVIPEESLQGAAVYFRKMECKRG